MANRSRMHVRPYKGRIVGKVIISSIKTEVGISNGGMRHVNRVNDLLKKTRGEVVVGIDVVNGGGWNGERKAKHTAYLTKGINKSHDQRSSHMSINKQSETDQTTTTERTIGN